MTPNSPSKLHLLTQRKLPDKSNTFLQNLTSSKSFLGNLYLVLLASSPSSHTSCYHTFSLCLKDEHGRDVWTIFWAILWHLLPFLSKWDVLRCSPQRTEKHKILVWRGKWPLSSYRFTWWWACHVDNMVSYLVFFWIVCCIISPMISIIDIVFWCLIHYSRSWGWTGHS